MTDKNSDEPIDGEDYFSNIHKVDDSEDPNWTVKKIHAFIFRRRD